MNHDIVYRLCENDGTLVNFGRTFVNISKTAVNFDRIEVVLSFF